MFQTIVIEGCIYGMMALGVFITFRVLDFPDLTVEGSLPLGAAIMGSCIVNGVNLYLALALALIGGVLAGMLTAFLHNELKIPNLLAGILTMIALYSINLRILGTSNVSLIRQKTIIGDIFNFLNSNFGLTREVSYMIFFVLLVFAIKFLLDIFFRTDLGLTLGALGNNQQMIISQGVNPKVLKIVGVGLSNGLVALAGAFVAQYQSFADVGLGQGIIVYGLASVMIGEFLIRSNKITWITTNVILGSIAFTFVITMARWFLFKVSFLEPTDMKILQVLIVILFLYLSKTRKIFKKKEVLSGKS